MSLKTPTRFGHSNPWLFFLLAFGWSWLVWSPSIIFGWEWGELRTLVSFALGVGPLLSALFLVYWGYADERPSQYWRRVTEVRRVPPVWWLVIVGLPFGINAVALAAPAGQIDQAAETITVTGLLFTVLVFGFGASFAEELGWRGYALDHLQRRSSALMAALIVGVAWGFWHLPLFLIEGSYQHGLGLWTMDFWFFMAWTILWSVLFTWIYNSTDRSILAVIVLHAMVNIAGETIGPEGDQVYVRFLLLAIVTVAVTLIWGWRTLSASVVTSSQPLRSTR